MPTLAGPRQHVAGLKRHPDPKEAEDGQTPNKLRRVRTKWTTAEEIDLLRGVDKFGVGVWASIHHRHSTFLDDIDLKDKWNVLTKPSNAEHLCELLSALAKQQLNDITFRMSVCS